MSLNLDYSYFFTEFGLKEEEWMQWMKQAQPAFAEVQKAKKAGQLGFAQILSQDEEVEAVAALAEEVRQECEAFVVIGIGGSDLGARAVHRALNHQFYNLLSSTKRCGPQLFFLGDTTDPVAIQEVLAVLNLAKTTFAVVSKSGNTVEQMSTFIYIRQLLLDQVGPDAPAKQIILVTDQETGTLRELVRQDGYRSLPIPSSVGGRFSVFSSVGLLPLAVTGIPIKQLLAGATSLDDHDSHATLQENLPWLYASLQYLAYQNGQIMSVFMPYIYSMREVGFWFRQLWAESLGKSLQVGPTPIAAVGPTDQHSQLQLYMEGPANKVITFVINKKSSADMALKEAYPEKEGVAYLAGHNFHTIVRAEQQSTAYALAEAGRPSCTIELDELTPFSLGQLLQFLEMSTAYAGELFDINTYNQPGVESSKQYMYGLLGRPGFADKKIPSLKHAYQINMEEK